jgi:hypothetical protein
MSFFMMFGTNGGGMTSEQRPVIDLISYTRWLAKWISIFGLGLIVLVGALVGGVYGWNWWSHGRHVELIRVGGERIGSSEKKIQVAGGVEVTAACSEDYPIFVWYKNDSGRTVNSLNVSVSAFLPGRSTDILDSSSVFSSDWILPLGEIQAECMSFGVKREFASDPGVARARYEFSINVVRFGN